MRTYLVARMFCNAVNDSVAIAAFREKIKNFLEKCLALSGVDMIIPVVFQTGGYAEHDTTGTLEWLGDTFVSPKISPLKIVRGGLYASALNQAGQFINGNIGIFSGDRVIFLSPEVEVDQLVIDELHQALNSDPRVKVAALNISGLSELIAAGRVQNTCCMWDLNEWLKGGGFALYCDPASAGDDKIEIPVTIDGKECLVEFAGNEEVPLLAAVGRNNGPFIAVIRKESPVDWHVDWDSPRQIKKLARKWQVGNRYLKQLNLSSNFLADKIIKTGW